MNKKAFTLVELLVVIAIIALLMSILMPALARVRKQAKVVICQSNLRQWGSIFSMYTADNDGSFQEGWAINPPRNWWMDSTKAYYSAGLMANEMADADIFFCPVAANETKKVEEGYSNFGIWDDEWLDNKGYKGSYGINGWVENRLVDRDYPEMAPKRWRTDRVNGAANIPLFMDAPWIDCWPEHWEDPPPFDNMHWQAIENHMARFCKNRHDGYINGVFLDYSVRKIGLKEMWLLKWHRTFDLNGPWTAEGGVKPEDWPPWMQKFKDY
jgi:prepilin-type N-terminal cleavage/methylation domain-containing protein